MSLTAEVKTGPSRQPEAPNASPAQMMPLLVMLAVLIAGGPAAGADDTGPKDVVLQETIFSKSLRFTGEVVEVLPSGKAIRKTAIHRGRTFTWRAKLGPRVATPEAERDVPAAPLDLDAISVEALAGNLRALALFNGHEFVEAVPAYDVARLAKTYHQREREGAPAEELSKLLPPVIPSQGRARPTRQLGKAEGTAPGGLAPRIVHGTDYRIVLDNSAYPHRVQIVFDNLGSNTAIETSQGSGSLIGPSTAMSVAHVFWDEANGTWEADHRWAPGYDSQDADPSRWGEFQCYWVAIPQAYTTHVNQNTYDYAVIDFDVGCNLVDNGVNSDQPGNTVGWLGAYTASNGDIQSTTGYVRGYPGPGTCGNPGQSCGVRVWGNFSSSSDNNATGDEIRHQADTSGGQSGSAFYQYTDPSCTGCGYGAYLVGMHRAGSTPYNIARKYDSTVSAFMHANSSDY